MKKRYVALILAGLLLAFALSGCSLMKIDAHLDAVEDAIDMRMDYAEDQVEAALRQSRSDRQAVSSPFVSSKMPAADLTAEQAQTIALEHAGYTSDQVTGMYTVCDMDDGVLQYEVQFRVGYWEYDYDIHADTGKILSFDVDT